MKPILKLYENKMADWCLALFINRTERVFEIVLGNSAALARAKAFAILGAMKDVDVIDEK